MLSILCCNILVSKRARYVTRPKSCSPAMQASGCQFRRGAVPFLNYITYQVKTAAHPDKMQRQLHAYKDCASLHLTYPTCMHDVMFNTVAPMLLRSPSSQTASRRLHVQPEPYIGLGVYTHGTLVINSQQKITSHDVLVIIVQSMVAILLNILMQTVGTCGCCWHSWGIWQAQCGNA